MLIVLRHLLAILLLPVVVTIGVPAWLLDRFADIDTRWRATPLASFCSRGVSCFLRAWGAGRSHRGIPLSVSSPSAPTATFVTP